MKFNEAISFINDSERIVILPHVSADGDSIGSSFAIKRVLDLMGKEADIFLEEDVQKRYRFATGNIEYLIAGEDGCLKNVKYDLAICVDCADLERLGERKEIFLNSKRKILMDHHEFNSGFADLNYIDVKWSATVMPVYELIKEIDPELINREIARLLYIGLVTDTGGFRHTNTVPKAHIMAAELLEYGINPSEVSQNVFDNMTFGRYLLNKESVNCAEFFFDGKVCICYMPEDVFIKCGASEEDSEGLTDYLRNIEGVEVSVFIRDKNGGMKISIRAKSYVDVATVAAVFSGGGHKRAAGASWNGSYEEFKERFLKELEPVI